MTSPQHVSLPLKSLLNDLSSTIPKCDPQDVAQTTELVQRLGSLRTTLEKEKSGPLAEVCGVALQMVDLLSRNGLVGPKESMDVVEEIVGVVRGGLGLPRQEERSKAPSKRDGPQLKLMDSQRLGELLVTLSMLKSEDVEKALKLQKMSGGMLLGEALVEHGVVTKESIQAALRLQSTRRRKEKKPPSWRDTLG